MPDEPTLSRPDSSLLPPDKFTILMTDDDQDMLEHMALIVELSGFKVVTTPHTPAVIDICRRQSISLITCDIMHPLMDGPLLLKTLRADPTIPRIPFVFISYSIPHIQEHVEQALAGDPDAMIRKPFDVDDLLGVIARLLPVDVKAAG